MFSRHFNEFSGCIVDKANANWTASHLVPFDDKKEKQIDELRPCQSPRRDAENLGYHQNKKDDPYFQTQKIVHLDYSDANTIKYFHVTSLGRRVRGLSQV